MGEHPTIPDGLSEYIHPLASTDPAGDQSDLLDMARLFENRRVIGLGEATHGTREYFRLKDRLIRFFVEEIGVRTVALEANFAEVLAINDYVLDGEGDPRDALAELHLWPWATQELLAMIRWLRAFNRGRRRQDRVRIYGLDAQYTTGAVAELRAFLKQVDPASLNQLDDVLDQVDDEGQPPAQDESLDRQLSAANQLLDELAPRFQAQEAAYVERTDEETVRLAERCLRTIDAVRAHKQAMAQGNIAEAMAIRDRAMADTVEWLLDATAADRVVISAHNGHVNRLENRSNGATAPSLGAHLAERFGDAYYALGFEFGGGEFRAITANGPNSDEDGNYSLGNQKVQQPLPDTLGRAFGALDETPFLLDLASAGADSNLDEWVGTPRRMHSFGAVFHQDEVTYHVERYPLAQAFDGLCYIENTNPTRPIQRE